MKGDSYVRASTRRPQAKRARADACGEVCDVEVIQADAVKVARAALPSAEARWNRIFDELFETREGPL